MGSAACKNDRHCPPYFCLKSQQWFCLPKFWEVDNNSNLVNKKIEEVNKISKHEILRYPCLISIAIPLNSISWLTDIDDYRIQ